MTASREPRDAGFMLVETIVAFLILAMALGVAVEAVSQAVASTRRAQSAAAVSLVAGEVLAAREDTVTGPGTWSGRHANGATWQMVAQRLRDDGPQQLYLLTLEVQPPGRASSQQFRTFVVGVPPS